MGKCCFLSLFPFNLVVVFTFAFDDDDDDDRMRIRMREYYNITMDAKIERCVEPLFGGGGLKKNDDDAKKTDDDGLRTTTIDDEGRISKLPKMFFDLGYLFSGASPMHGMEEYSCRGPE